MTSAQGEKPKLTLRLYVVSGAPNSNAARANLASILSALDANEYALEFVDCSAEPRRALAEGVLVTPTLIKSAPDPTQTIIGSLSDRAGVLAALGLRANGVKTADA